MKHNGIHSITRSPSTYLRLALIAALVTIATIFLRQPDADIVQFLNDQARNLTVLYAILVGFIAAEVLSRRRRMDEQIALELNKIRRLYHLSLHLAKANPGLKDWFENTRESIKMYLKSFEKKSFLEYEKGNSLFRDITYGIYSLPLEKMKYGNDMFASLLSAAASATEAREYIRQTLYQQYVGQFAWMTLLLVSVTFGSFLILATPEDLAHRLATGIIVFNLFLVLQLIYEYGRINAIKSEAYNAMYRQDLISLGLNGRSGKKS